MGINYEFRRIDESYARDDTPGPIPIVRPIKLFPGVCSDYVLVNV